MQLMTKELQAEFKKMGRQEHENADDTIILAHFFNPTGGGDWFISEYNEEEETIYGYASLFNDHCNEWGYTSLDELQNMRLPFELGIERERSWTPCTIKQACKEKGIYYREN